jgi:ethanolamine utilization protein EutQ (cupin superfamily)
MSVRHFTAKDAEWFQYRDRQIFVGDVVDSSNSQTNIGFYRNRRKGERNEWVVTYDEALIVTRRRLDHSFSGRHKDREGGRGYLPEQGHEGCLRSRGG